MNVARDILQVVMTEDMTHACRQNVLIYRPAQCAGTESDVELELNQVADRVYGMADVG